MSDDDLAKELFESDSDDDHVGESFAEDEPCSGNDEDDFVWNHNTTRLMLNLLTQHKDEFTTKSEREIVTKAVQRKMRKLGFKVPKQGVAKKWNYLRTTFRRIAMADRKLITWEYFDAVKEVMGSEADLLLKMKGAPYQRISFSKSVSPNSSSMPHIISIRQPDTSPTYTCVIEANEESPSITFSHNIKIEDSSDESDKEENFFISHKELVSPLKLDSELLKLDSACDKITTKDSMKLDLKDFKMESKEQIFNGLSPGESQLIEMQLREEERTERMEDQEVQQKNYEMLEKIASQLEQLSKREDQIIGILRRLANE